MEANGYSSRTVFRRLPRLFSFADFAQKRGCADVASAFALVEEFVSDRLVQHGAGAKTSASLRRQPCRHACLTSELLQVLICGQQCVLNRLLCIGLWLLDEACTLAAIISFAVLGCCWSVADALLMRSAMMCSPVCPREAESEGGRFAFGSQPKFLCLSAVASCLVRPAEARRVLSKGASGAFIEAQRRPLTDSDRLCRKAARSRGT